MDNKYTPAKICEEEKCFNIPIYQRLFEWGNEQIEQLLNDLYNQYKKNTENPEPYYVGLLTLHKNDLVDGQQRFTVLSIFASVFKEYHDKWKKMYGRLSLTARPEDEKYLKSLFEATPTTEQGNYKNEKMFNGKECVEKWMDSNLGDDSAKKSSFAKYVFEYCTFFTAQLPDKYEAKDLNSYFEAMNSTGRNLEAHEIIKVRSYLSSMNDEQQKYTLIWNLVADMDKPLIRKKENENEESLRSRYQNAINDFEKNISSLDFNNHINDYHLEGTEISADQTLPTIKDIAISHRNPDVRRQEKYYGEGCHSMLNFPEFLLQILYLEQPKMHNGEREVSVNEFFNKHNLQKTFENYTKDWKEDEWKNFGKDLLLYRLIYDYYFIRVANVEGGDYDLEFTDADGSNNSTILKQYESFLYADSTALTYYRWIAPMLEYIKGNRDLKAQQVLTQLHEIDDSVPEHKIEVLNNEKELEYRSQKTVYFLRRLDFLLWLANKNHSFSGEGDNCVSNYLFRRGINSKEHLHPQTEKQNVVTQDGWNDESLNSFGNMFLISQSSNSSQSNNGINGKLINFADEVRNGHLESIKLYLVYKKHGKEFATWTPEKAKEHQDKMIAFLRESYGEKFLDIKLDIDAITEPQ